VIQWGHTDKKTRKDKLMSAPTATNSFYNGEHPLFKQLFDVLSDNARNYSVIAGQIAAADGDKDKAIAAWIETSENSRAVKLRAAIQKATEELNKLAEDNVVIEHLTDEQKLKLQTEANTHRDKAKAGLDAVKSVVQAMPISDADKEQVQSAIEDVTKTIGSGRGRKAGEKGSSLPRASVTLTVTGGNLKDEPFDTFTALAQKLSCEAKELQLAYASAAGVAHEDIKEVKEPVTFKFTPPIEGASEYTILTAPKQGKPRGRQPVAVSKNEAGKSDESAPANEDAPQAE
jgi:hypothetical protein